MLEVRSVKEFEGFEVLGYYCRGHVLANDFLEGLRSHFDLKCDSENIKHQYQRNVPVYGEKGVYCVHSAKGPGRGVYPITWIDAEHCVDDASDCPGITPTSY